MKTWEKMTRALEIARTAHEGQTDHEGRAKIDHVMRVALRVAPDPELQVVAILHDVVEDSSWTLEQVGLECELDIWEIEALELLTKPEGADYQTYIQAIIDSDNEIAQLVKMADLADNYGRLPEEPTEWSERLRWRYAHAIERFKVQGFSVHIERQLEMW